MKNPLQIYSIQMLRGVAASMVVIAHSGLLVYYGKMNDAVLNAFYIFGNLGVDTFFGISGCLMVITMRHKFGQPGSPWEFLKRRIIRIVPLYWIITILMIAIVFAKGDHIPLEQILKSLFFIPYLSSGGEMRPIIQVGWTLNYEMFFYCIFALTLFLSFRYGLILNGIIFLSITALGQSIKSIYDTSDPTNLAQAWTNPLILVFFSGSLVALAWPILCGRYQPRSSFLVITLSVIVLFLTTACGSIFTSLPPHSLLAETLIRLGAVVTVLVCLIPHKPPILMVEKLLYLLGNASYSTYLTHPFALRYSAIAAKWLHLPDISLMFLFLISANILGVIVHKLIELPLLKMSRSEKNLTFIFKTASKT